MLPGPLTPTLPFSFGFGIISHEYEVGNSSAQSAAVFGPKKGIMDRTHENGRWG